MTLPTREQYRQDKTLYKHFKNKCKVCSVEGCEERPAGGMRGVLCTHCGRRGYYGWLCEEHKEMHKAFEGLGWSCFRGWRGKYKFNEGLYKAIKRVWQDSWYK